MSQADFSESSYNISLHTWAPSFIVIESRMRTHLRHAQRDAMPLLPVGSIPPRLQQKVMCRQIQRCTKEWRKDSFKDSPPAAAQNRNLARVWLFHSCYWFGHNTINIAERQCFTDTAYWETAGAILTQFWMLWQLEGLITQTFPTDWGHPLPLYHH